MEENKKLKIGDLIPEIIGLNQNNKTIKREDLLGHNTIIYFYPKDNTPGCTAEACSLRDNIEQFEKLNYRVIGVSADSVESHLKFIEKKQLPFDLIADVDKKLIKEFGAWGEMKFMGKVYDGILRTTFIIDKTGHITDIMTPKEVKTKIHAEQLLEKIKQN